MRWTMALAVGMMVTSVGLPGARGQDERQRDSATVIRQGPGGEVQILSTEREGGVPPPRSVAPEAREAAAPANDAARKARVMVVPAIFQQEARRRVDRELNNRFNITDPGVIESPGYTSFIVDALVNARKFDLLEREELRSAIKELDFGESDYADPAKVAKIGQMVGADFMIVPEIRYLDCQRETKVVPYVGGEQNTLKCKLATAVRTVSVSTGKIVASNIKEVEKRKRVRGTDTAEAVRLGILDLIAESLRESALREAANIVDVAYPIRIMSIDGDTVMLNRGQGAIINGEKLKVFAVGEVMVDPDTKENLGYQEAYVGLLQVTDVDQKTSKAAIIERVAPFQRLYLCRRVEPPTLTDPALRALPAEPPAPRID
jgi:curli biogenesis system outer membrane secretion channel CsgG